METKVNIYVAVVSSLIASAFGAFVGVAGTIYILGERIARLETEVEHVKSQQSKFSDKISILEERIQDIKMLAKLEIEVKDLKNQVESHAKKIAVLITQIVQVPTESKPVVSSVTVISPWKDKIKFHSPDGRYGAVIVGEGNDRHYELREIETGRIVLTTHAQYSTPNEVKAGIFSPDSKKFAAAYHYGHEGGYTWIAIWDIESGGLSRSERKSGWTTDIESMFGKAGK